MCSEKCRALSPRFCNFSIPNQTADQYECEDYPEAGPKMRNFHCNLFCLYYAGGTALLANA